MLIYVHAEEEGRDHVSALRNLTLSANSGYLMWGMNDKRLRLKLQILWLALQVNFLGNRLDHASCGIFTYMLLVASKYRVQALNLLRIRCEIFGQTSILLPIDIDSLQQLNKNVWPVYVLLLTAYMT